MEDTSEQPLDPTVEKISTDSSMDKKNDKGTPSQKQLKHLAYARQMKKLKAQEKAQEVEAQSKHLDFIYKRLTNIEKTVGDIKETTHFNPQYKRKRSTSIRKEEEDNSDEPINKKEKKNDGTGKPAQAVTSHLYDNIIHYASRACFMVAGSIALSLIKQYATRQTADGDNVGGYYVG